MGGEGEELGVDGWWKERVKGGEFVGDGRRV